LDGGAPAGAEALNRTALLPDALPEEVTLAWPLSAPLSASALVA
jgi:hypothetical protein